MILVHSMLLDWGSQAEKEMTIGKMINWLSLKTMFTIIMRQIIGPVNPRCYCCCLTVLLLFYKK